MGETLKRRFGPLPVWAWALIFVALLAAFLYYRKKQAANAAAAQAAAQSQGTSSNLGTVPVSNLTTAAQPMPVQLGDTFVNTTVPNTVNVNPTITNPPPPSYTLQTAPPPAPSPVITSIPQPQGYGANIGALLGLNPNLLKSNTQPGGVNVPGITGYKVSYNGIPL